MSYYFDIVNENANKGVFIGTPANVILTGELDRSKLVDQRWLKYIIANDEKKAFYNLSVWRYNVSQDVLKRDHWECQLCKREGRLTTRTQSGLLQVHHILPLEEYPLYCLNMTTLVTLCYDCHNRVHERMRYAPKKHTDYLNFDPTELEP